MAGVLVADDPQNTLATDNLAVYTPGFNRGFDFHL
jgi:hypothetical protein